MVALRIGLVMVALGTLVFAGCAAPEPAAQPDGATPPSVRPPSDPWHGETRLAILDIKFDGFEFDVKCLGGGGVQVRRTSEWVLNGTARLEFKLSADPTFTGLQIGYTLDGNDAYDERQSTKPITWFGPVSAGSKTFSVDVAPDQVETEETRWRFFERHNLPAAQQDCYTGGGTGKWSALVEAVKGGS